MSIAFLLTTLVVVAAFCCTLGVVPHMIAAITGLAAVLNASAVAFRTVTWAGVLYLLFLAWQTLRDTSTIRSTIRTDEDAAPLASWRIVRTAVLINLLNPKLTIFFLAFLPQFVPVGEVDGTWHVIGRPRVLTWMRRTFAGTYVLLAGRLAVESR